MKHLISAPVASFTDLLLDAVCMVDVNGRFVFVSAACERIFGYTQEEMIGMVMLDLVAPADRQRTIAAAQAIMNGHAQVHFENRYTRKDGRVAHIMWSARWSATDQLRVAVARDITTLKQTQAKQAALYAISEAAHATEELPALLQRIHQIVRELLPACGLTVSLLDEHGQHLHHAQQGLDGAPATHAALAGLLCEEVQRSGRALLIEPGQLAG